MSFFGHLLQFKLMCFIALTVILVVLLILVLVVTVVVVIRLNAVAFNPLKPESNPIRHSLA